MGNKKEYEKPELKTHGDIKRITKGTSGGVGGDAGSYRPSH